MSIKEALRADYGDSVKYVNFVSTKETGKAADTVALLNQAKIDEDLLFAGYNLLVTSETKKTPKEIYEAYHGLWRIEESFRVMTTYLEDRPVYLQTKESIYGHFLIGYLALTALRLLELKVFKDKLPIGQIAEFIRNYNIMQTIDGSFVNNANKTPTLEAIKDKFGLSKLDNMFLNKKDGDNILNATIDL